MPKGIKGFQKGHKSYLTEESKDKIRNTLKVVNLGHKISKDTRLKISNTLKDGYKNGSIKHPLIGVKFSPEVCKKISDGHKGQTPWNKGKHNIYSDEIRAKFGSAMRGKRHSTKTIEKMRTSGRIRFLTGKSSLPKIRFGKDNPMYGRRGELSHMWKGGLSKLNLLIRASSEYFLWRTNVFTRDGWECKNCGSKDRKIEAHHIKSFSSILINNKIKTIVEAYKCAELWNVDNGVTLCEDCHKLTDNYKGRAINEK